jgi:hypothetical protein
MNNVPIGLRPFSAYGSLVLTIPSTVPSDIFRYRVPDGFEGVLQARFHNMSVGVLVEGSGDVIWRLRLDLWYPRDCGESLFTMGSQSWLEPLGGGIRVASGQTLHYEVQAPNVTGSLPLGSRVSAGVRGWLWPL